MQDLLVYVTKGLSAITTQLRTEGKTVSEDVNHLITWNLFTTITNANFDKAAIVSRIADTLQTRRALFAEVSDTAGLPKAAFYDVEVSSDGPLPEAALMEKANEVGILATENEDIRSLRELITYGLSAYSKHANVLLSEDGDIDAFLQRALAATLDDSLTAEDLVALALETGNYGVKGMAMLDAANTGAYGNPEITKVNIGVYPLGDAACALLSCV